MKIKKNAQRIVSCVLALLTALPFVLLTAAAQGETAQTPEILWARLYTRYADVYLIGQADQSYMRGAADVICRMADGTERRMQSECPDITCLDADHFLLPLELEDPLCVRSVTILFSEGFFSDGSPAFTYTTDDPVSSSPILRREYRPFSGGSYFLFDGESEGTTIRVPLLPDDIMFLPLQGKEEIPGDLSFRFGSRLVPTRYTYDGETLVIERLGTVHHYSFIDILEREHTIERWVQMDYRDERSLCMIRIEDPSIALLFQQRRMLWVYLICGGFFERLFNRY